MSDYEKQWRSQYWHLEADPEKRLVFGAVKDIENCGARIAEFWKTAGPHSVELEREIADNLTAHVATILAAHRKLMRFCFGEYVAKAIDEFGNEL